MQATLELTPVILQACLLNKRLSARNEGLNEGKVIKSVRTIEIRDNMTVFCFGMINDARAGYIVIPASILPELLETGRATKTYTNEACQEYNCYWYLKDPE